jgi:hypothetical protein
MAIPIGSGAQNVFNAANSRLLPSSLSTGRQMASAEATKAASDQVGRNMTSDITKPNAGVGMAKAGGDAALIQNEKMMASQQQSAAMQMRNSLQTALQESAKEMIAALAKSIIGAGKAVSSLVS